MVANTNQPTTYRDPSGRGIQSMTSKVVLFSDDFGGSAVDTAVRWDVFNGGVPANPTLHGQTLTQGAIGSGTTGITYAVASSGLTVSMNTTNGAELQFLSQQVFSGTEDILVIASKSQPIVANSIFIGLVEVDPVTLLPFLNPNLTGEFTNRAGIEYGQTAVTTAYRCEAIGDSSGSVAFGSTGVATSALTVTQEFVAEVTAEDVIGSTQAVDTTGSRNASPSRVSTQCANDTVLYKLAMRFRNVNVPGGNTDFVIQRVLVLDRHELNVEITSGRGDANQQKSVGVQINGSSATGASSLTVQGSQSDNTAIAGGGVLEVGGVMKSTSPAVGTTARVGALLLDLARRLVIKSGGLAQLQVNSGEISTNGVTAVTLFAATASVRNEIEVISISNPDTVAHMYQLLDNAVIVQRFGPIAASAGMTISKTGLWSQSAVNQAWTVKQTEATTTTASVITASGFSSVA